MSEIKKVSKDVNSDLTIDLRGLNCPLPLLRLKKEITKLETNQVLQANCTDSGCRSDFSGWCARIGYKYLGESNQKTFISYYIQKI
jgi:TusA-related sulfurtransferase